MYLKALAEHARLNILPKERGQAIADGLLELSGVTPDVSPDVLRSGFKIASLGESKRRSVCAELYKLSEHLGIESDKYDDSAAADVWTQWVNFYSGKEDNIASVLIVERDEILSFVSNGESTFDKLGNVK